MTLQFADLAVVVRFIHYGAVTLLLGAFAFLLFVARPAFKRAEGIFHVQAARERFDLTVIRIAGWGVIVALLSGFAWLWLQAALVSGQTLGEALTSGAIGGVLGKTQFGRLWQLRLGLIALLGAFMLFRERERDGKDWIAFRVEGLILAGGLTASLAWAGHAAATQGSAIILHLVADAIHLLAASVWLGGLLPLAILLAWAWRFLDPPWADVAQDATRRFSNLALLAVSILVLTGIVNTWMIVADIPHLVGTSYGRILLLKLALLLPLMGIAAVNLLRLKPGLAAALVHESDETLRDLLRRLRRNVIAETCLGAVILLIVGALGITPPARHIQPVWPFSFRLSWEATKNIPGVQTSLIVGSVGMLLALMVLAFGIFRRRYRPWAIGIGLSLFVGFGVLPVRALTLDAHPTTFVRPAVPYTALSIARGDRLYREHCAVCHGAAGYGDAPAAAGLPQKPVDLTGKHTAEHTAGDLFWLLSHGIPGSPMPGFKEKISERERWDLINFLRTLGAAEEARRIGPLVEPTPWLVAPDFRFGTGVGPGQTLKEQRGWSIVHLVLFTLPGSLPRLEEIAGALGQIGLSGARLITVPMREANEVYRRLGVRTANIRVAADGNQEIVETYTLFRRTLAHEGVGQPPTHIEFLIDRQGYLRARFIPGEGAGWEIPRLLKEIDRLAKETPRAPAPDEHVH